MKLQAVLAATVVFAACAVYAASPPDATYVGSETCSMCHPEEFENFKTYAKKAKSAESIQVMASDLKKEELEGCYACHTTGYGEPSGFKSYEETPELGDAGCEVCHGPGSEHVDMGGDPSLIKADLSLKDCTGCHNEERVRSFDFKPLLYGGAH